MPGSGRRGGYNLCGKNLQKKKVPAQAVSVVSWSRGSLGHSGPGPAFRGARLSVPAGPGCGGRRRSSLALAGVGRLGCGCPSPLAYRRPRPPLVLPRWSKETWTLVPSIGAGCSVCPGCVWVRCVSWLRFCGVGAAPARRGGPGLAGLGRCGAWSCACPGAACRPAMRRPGCRSVAAPAPLVVTAAKGNGPRPLRGRGLIVEMWKTLQIPPSRLTASHLPLHKTGQFSNLVCA